MDLNIRHRCDESRTRHFLLLKIFSIGPPSFRTFLNLCWCHDTRWWSGCQPTYQSPRFFPNNLSSSPRNKTKKKKKTTKRFLSDTYPVFVFFPSFPPRKCLNSKQINFFLFCLQVRLKKTIKNFKSHVKMMRDRKTLEDHSNSSDMLLWYDNTGCWRKWLLLIWNVKWCGLRVLLVIHFKVGTNSYIGRKIKQKIF